jgi:hypothetical protein
VNRVINKKMKKLIVMGLFTTTTSFLFAQQPDNVINAKEAEKIEKVLAADDMHGRKVFTPDLDRAADFISQEFRQAGLQTWHGEHSFLQSFVLLKPKFISASGNLDGKPLDQKNIMVITSQPEFKMDQNSGYEKAMIRAGADFFNEAYRYFQSGRNYFITVDTSFAKKFPRLAQFKSGIYKSDKSVVYVLDDKEPAVFSIEARHNITGQKLANVVGVLPGKAKKDEYVIFSGHYDHIGVGQPENGDSIFNGANDDASGTTAVILLARYFRALNKNERTLIFVAFTAEEIGGFGSQYFSKQFEPSKVAAMFNIEMIGTESKWGRNSAYITGYEKTDMGKILQKNLEGTGFTFYPDPYLEQQLFYRSDNATLAMLGVPAHSISTSKMDNEPNYHKVSDQVEMLDMANMAMIIRSIALSAKTIIAGSDTPSRVNVKDLR